jgi:hypothetical protein
MIPFSSKMLKRNPLPRFAFTSFGENKPGAFIILTRVFFRPRGSRECLGAN